MKLNLFGTKNIGKVLVLDGNNVVGYRVVNLLLREGEYPGVELRVGFQRFPSLGELEEGWVNVIQEKKQDK